MFAGLIYTDLDFSGNKHFRVRLVIVSCSNKAFFWTVKKRKNSANALLLAKIKYYKFFVWIAGVNSPFWEMLWENTHHFSDTRLAMWRKPLILVQDTSNQLLEKTV